MNPALAALPRIALQPQRPSDYDRIRREPADFCVSTIEALAEVLNVLERRRALRSRCWCRFAPWSIGRSGSPSEIALEPPPASVRDAASGARPTLAMRLRAEWSRLVCVQGEANGWPVRHPARQDPEIVHFVAVPPGDGRALRSGGGAAPPAGADDPAPHRAVRGAARRRRQPSRTGSVRGARSARPTMCSCSGAASTPTWQRRKALALSQRRIDLRGEMTQSSVRPRGGTLEECVDAAGARR